MFKYNVSGGHQESNTILLGRKTVVDLGKTPVRGPSVLHCLHVLRSELKGSHGEVNSALWHGCRALSFRGFEVSRSSAF